MKTYKEFLSESSLSKVQKAWSEHDTGTITAFRFAKDCGEGDKYTTKSNKDRNLVLKFKILSKGFGVTKVKGSWLENGDVEVGEESFFVVDLKDSGKLKQTLQEFGYEFEQDAITYADKQSDYYAIGTNKCPGAFPGYKKEVKLGKPTFGKVGVDGFSRVNGRAFVFESTTFDVITDYPPTEIRSIHKSNEINIKEL